MSDDEKFRWIWYMTICAVFILVNALVAYRFWGAILSLYRD
jgi:hypothetical protein